MSRCRFVQPELTRLSLSQGDFIDVKKQLNAGEQRRVFGRMVRDMTPGEKVTLDPEQVGRTKLVEYIVGWSFTGADGQPVPFSESALDNLNTETYAELIKAIDAHETAQEAERKNAQAAGESNSATTSSSAA